jgi:hypothetical protein
MKSTDRRAVQEALRRLPYRDRESLARAALKSALETIPTSESEQILAMAETLATSMNKMGSLIALEVLAAVGMLWSESSVTDGE